MRRFVISDLSMSPALTPGDTFLARRLRRPQRGVVALFPHPDRPELWLAKRVIGLAGETLSVHAGLVYVDGVELEEPWTTDDTGPDGEWAIPSRHMFVLSDARHRTLADSRTMGPVPVRGAHTPWLRYRQGGAP